MKNVVLQIIHEVRVIKSKPRVHFLIKVLKQNGTYHEDDQNQKTELREMIIKMHSNFKPKILEEDVKFTKLSSRLNRILNMVDFNFRSIQD